MADPVEYLPVVHEPTGDEPEDIGTGHTMREVTERVARDTRAWNPALARLVGEFFDERAPGWSEERSARSDVLADALERGGPLDAPVVELGAGTGAGTAVLAERFGHVTAGDLSAEMLTRLTVPAVSRLRLDASTLPLRDGSVGTLVCVNMFLFPAEARRVLAPDGALVWVNSIGERTPIHLSADAVSEAIGDGFDVLASRAGWGTWAVARRRRA